MTTIVLGLVAVALVGLRERSRAAARHKGMRRVLLVLAGLAALLVLVPPRAASACSCRSPTPLVAFDGVVEAESVPANPPGNPPGFPVPGLDYDFRVERVFGGEVHPSEKVRVFTGGSSMCGVGDRLLVGGRYRMSAYVSATPEGSRLLFVTLCGGTRELLAAPPVPQPPPGAETLPPAEDDLGSTPWFVLGAVAAAALTAGVVLLRKRSRLAGRAMLSTAASDIGLFAVPVVVGLVTARLVGGDWNWAPAIFFAVPISGAAVLGRRERRQQGASKPTGDTRGR